MRSLGPYPSGIFCLEEALQAMAGLKQLAWLGLNATSMKVKEAGEVSRPGLENQKGCILRHL